MHFHTRNSLINFLGCGCGWILHYPGVPALEGLEGRRREGAAGEGDHAHCLRVRGGHSHCSLSLTMKMAIPRCSFFSFFLFASEVATPIASECGLAIRIAREGHSHSSLSLTMKMVISRCSLFSFFLFSQDFSGEDESYKNFHKMCSRKDKKHALIKTCESNPTTIITTTDRH